MLIKIAWRNVWRNKRRSFITIAAIFIAVFLAILMRSLQLGMYENMIKNVVGSFSGYVQIHSKGYWEDKNINNSFEVSESVLNSINKIEGVSNIIKRVQTGVLSSNNKLSKFLYVTGIEQEAEEKLTDWNKRLIDGTLLDDNGQSIIVAKGVAKYYDAKVGDSLIFIGQGYHGMQAVGIYPIQGVIDMKNPNLNNMSVFMSLKSAQDFVSAKNRITNLVIDKEQYFNEVKIAEKVKSKIDIQSRDVMTWKEMTPQLDQLIEADNAGGILIIIILYMIVGFGIFGTVLMMTQERLYEFGVLISIGMKKSKLMIILIYETIFLTFVGVLVGFVISWPIVNYFHYNPLKLFGAAADQLESAGFEPIIPFMNTYDIPLVHGFIIILISLITCIYPIIIISKLKPIKAMNR
ncbi:MAG: putative ABC transport system permease protein [Candidatus Marivariicella framensis]|jgi:putative ABC transport system permease protein|tara:strand:- start:3465 stop:4682 length:1218 start_codon:yes stop_codon:yes gene_type:complete